MEAGWSALDRRLGRESPRSAAPGVRQPELLATHRSAPIVSGEGHLELLSGRRAQPSNARTGSRRSYTGLILIIIAWGCGILHAEVSDSIRENRLRAGYLLNFSKFVEWPSVGATDALTICFVGGSGIRDAFTAGAGGQQVGARPVVTRSLSARASPEGCQVLYIEAAAPFSRDYMSAAVNPALLTVGDAQDFIHKGGIVELFADSNRLRFNVNLDNARRAGLRI